MMNRLKAIRERGFSLVEMAIGLGIVAAVLGTLWAVTASFYENYKVNKTVEGVFTTARNVQNLISIAASQAIGQGIDITQTLLQAGIFPEDWVSENTAKNPFGGNIKVINGADGTNRFGMYISGINKSAFIKLITNVSSIGSMAGSRGEGLNSRFSLGYIYVLNEEKSILSMAIYNFPISPEIANAACVYNTNTINFGFGYTHNHF